MLFRSNADIYAEKINKTTNELRNADYFVVCIPETSPIDEMWDVENIIKTYGGKISGYIINNKRGESHEKKQILRVYEKSQKRNTPVIEISHDIRLCDSNTRSRRKALREIGDYFSII